MNTVFLLLAKYDSPRLNINQIADFMHVSTATVQNKVYAKRLPFPVYKEGGQIFADLNDVAAYHDKMCSEARAVQDAVERSLR